MLNLDLQGILNQDDVASAMNDLRALQMPAGVDNTTLADLDKFRVNPYKGYLAANGVMVSSGTKLPFGTEEGPGDGKLLPVDIAKQLGMSASEYLKYRNLTINHETGGTFDPRQKQVGGGPGRGLFQFEPDAMETSATRLKSYFDSTGTAVPDFVEKVSNGKVKDASELSPADQEMLFLGQMMQVGKDSKVSLNKAVMGLSSLDDYANAWAKTHNRSKASKRAARKKKFTEDNMPVFDKAETLIDLSPTTPPFMPGQGPSQASSPGQIPQAGLGKWLRKRWDDVKKVGNFAWDGVKSGADMQLSMLGMNDVIEDTWVDDSSFLSTYANIGNKVLKTGLDVFVPGAGTALGVVGGAVNNGVNQGRQNRAAQQQPQMQYPGMDVNMPSPGVNVGSFFGGGQSPFGGGTGDSNMMALMQLLPLLMNNGNQSGAAGILGGGFTGQGIFENGGLVSEGVIIPGNRMPIQAEKFKGKLESVVLPTGHVAFTNATTKHAKMDKDTITDIVADGTYVASAQPRMALPVSKFEDIEFGYQEQLYIEGQANPMPRKFTAAEVIPKGTKKVLPTEYAEMVAKHFPLAESTDIFTEAANKDNLRARIPYLSALVALGEGKKGEVEAMSNGGMVQKAPLGDFISIATTALPFITQAAQSFNGNPANGFGGNGLDPINDAMMTGSFPLSTLGITRNINAQNRALGDARQGLQNLTAEQMRLNDSGTAIGVATAMGQETELERLTQDFSRLTNFRTGTPQSFINAAATPAQDMRSMIDALGPGAAASVMANSGAASMQARNDAAMRAFSQKQAQDLGIAQTVTQGLNAQEQFNNQLSQQELALRNNRLGAVGGQLQGNVQNRSQLLANQFAGDTQLSLQQAGLAGQKEAAIAQQMMNLASTRQAFLSQTNPRPPAPPAPLPFGQQNASINTIGATRDDVMNMFYPDLPQINVPPRSGITPLPPSIFSPVPYGNSEIPPNLG